MRKDVVKIPGYNHPTVRCFLPLISELEELLDSKKIKSIRYREGKNQGKEFTYTIRPYDLQNNLVKMTVKYMGWMQEFILSTDSSNIIKLKEFMSKYSL